MKIFTRENMFSIVKIRVVTIKFVEVVKYCLKIRKCVLIAKKYLIWFVKVNL
jgi:hypothetical protein